MHTFNCRLCKGKGIDNTELRLQTFFFLVMNNSLFGMILLAELGDKKHHKNQTASME
jgi:hypothetical protein